MSKAQNIRKKALDFVRDQDWPNAIKEYRRLIELDQSNPNVHNELADIYLKTNQKAEAYDAFVRAVDEYVRVGLHNNAVAVCKKVLRVLPARSDVLVKLGFIRSRQGLAKEAESYYLSFLEKEAGGGFVAADFQKLAGQIAEDMSESVIVMDRLAQGLLAYGLKDDAGNILIKLALLCDRTGDSTVAERTRAGIEKLGIGERLEAARGGHPPSDRTVITEDNLWTKTHTEGERIQIESTPHYTPPGSPAAPAPQPAGAAPGAAPNSATSTPSSTAPSGPSERDLYLIRLARGSAEPHRPAAAPAAPAPEKADAPSAAGTTATIEETPAAPPAAEVEATPAPPAPPVSKPAAPPSSKPAAPPPPPQSSTPASAPRTAPAPSPAASGGMQISALLDDEDTASSGEDYRSHYDLGMAYLEMDLLSEAIREYQLAAKSPQYQVKCLEMIGQCFIKQSQPQLAIRQLTKGLTLIGPESEESLGIKYNLALAYEMIGDLANARTYYEDVYVVDVTFRDVADKIRRLTAS